MSDDTKTVTVIELLQDIDAAVARMGKSNPHRNLLQRCGLGLIELARRARKMEDAPVEEPVTV